MGPEPEPTEITAKAPTKSLRRIQFWHNLGHPANTDPTEE